MDELTVYLSGGLHGDWQSRVMEAVPNFKYYNPQDLQDLWEEDARGVVSTELEWIVDSDIAFCYLEHDNPSGIGLSAELGFAKARGKYVILVIEKVEHYWEFLMLLADYTTGDFEDGLARLRTMGALENYKKRMEDDKPSKG